MHISLISYTSTNEWLGFETLRRLSGKEYTPAHFFITDACGIYNNIHDVPIKELQDYDAVFLLGNPVTKYKVNHPVYKYKEVAICEDNAEVIHVACDWLGIPVITLNIFFDEPEYRTKPLPNRNIYTNIVGSTAYSVLDPIVKHLNLNRDSKVLVYLAEPIIMSTSREGKVTKRIIKFLRNYK